MKKQHKTMGQWLHVMANEYTKDNNMKVGDKVEYYTTRIAWLPSRGCNHEFVKHHTGTLLSVSDLECRILPDGKTKAIMVIRERVKKRN